MPKPGTAMSMSRMPTRLSTGRGCDALDQVLEVAALAGAEIPFIVDGELRAPSAQAMAVPDIGSRR